MSRHQRFTRMAVALGAVFAFCLSLLFLADSGIGTPSEKSHTTFFLLSQVRQTDQTASAPTGMEDPLSRTRLSPSSADAPLVEFHSGTPATSTPLARPTDRIPLPLEPGLPSEPIDVDDVANDTPNVDPATGRPEGAAPEGRSYREVRALVTAYCPCARCCGRHANGRTSIGTTAWRPGMAADPRAVPYGTLVEVPGYGTYPIDDTGGAMRQSWRRRGVIHIDIRMTYHWQAREWGRRYMTIRIYDQD